MPDYCTLIVRPPKVPFDFSEARLTLETGSEKAKIETMKTVLEAIANGEPAGPLVMHIIRFVMPNQKNKLLKKLVLLFFEMVPKTDEDGKLLQEMILLCNALRNDLQHPNEYVRGVTLRFVCKLTEPELLEPLLPVMRACLEHNHAYVRRNAIFAIWSVYRTNEFMIPDAPELIEQVLAAETDSSCQRNAFIMLSQTEPSRASAFFDSISHKVTTMDPLLQQAVIEFMLNDAASDPEKKSNYIQILYDIISFSNQNMVKFEACSVLMTLSSAPAAIKAVAQCYIEMAIKESENNSKLIVLDRLQSLQKLHSAVVNENILDVLKVLSSNDNEVRRKSIALVLDGLNLRSAEEIVLYLRKEYTKLTQTDADRNAVDYLRELLRAIHICTQKFPKTGDLAIQTWVEFYGSPEKTLLREVSTYLKETLEARPDLRATAISDLVQVLAMSSNHCAIQSLFWTLGEFASELPAIEEIFSVVKNGLGEFPMVVAAEKAQSEVENTNEPSGNFISSTKVLADGTYVTETSYSKHHSMGSANQPNIKKVLLEGQFQVGASLCMCLTKLVLKLEGIFENPAKINAMKASVMLIGTSIIRFGLSRFPSTNIDQDSYDRIMTCIRVLSKPETSIELVFTKECKKAFDQFTRSYQRYEALGFDKEAKKISDSIVFRQVKALEDKNRILPTNYAVQDIQRATEDKLIGNRLASSLSKVVQLTGFSDPIYAETYVNVSHNDILLDILVVNQTSETLQNVTIDLSTSGDLKIVDKPANFSLSPGAFSAVKVGIKVSSTDNGLVYGCITFGSVETTTVVIANVTIDIVDYIQAKSILEVDFRQFWTGLEWENKINIAPVPSTVSSPSETLKVFLSSLIQYTNLACITPAFGLSEGGEYLAANMYAQSVFGEDILANICLERSGSVETGMTISGHVRLRSKTQGIAIALGEKINLFVQGLSQGRH